MSKCSFVLSLTGSTFLASVLMSSLIGLAAVTAKADPVWDVGGTIAISGTNAPDNFSQNVTLSSGSSSIDSGTLTLTQSVAPGPNGAEWFILDYQAASNTVIAGNTSNYWELQAFVPMAQPDNSLGFYFDWGLNGTLYSATTGGPFTGIATNPVTGSGSVFANSSLCSYNSCGYINTTNNTVDFFVSLNPYSLISGSGISLSAANEFQIGVLAQPVAPVPEPATLSLLLSGVVIGGFAMRRRRAPS